MLGRKRKERKMEEAKSKVETILGAGTKIDGELYTRGSLRVEGEINGNIKADGDLFIGESGTLNAEIIARNVIIAGTVTGNITASQKIELMPSGKLNGDIQAKVLKIEEGAIFNGRSKPANKEKIANVSVNKVKEEVAVTKQ